jgi:hypothetical protein
MPGYFPRQSIAWKRDEAAAFRALTLSATELGLLTGVVLRLARALALARGPGGSVNYLAATYYVVATVVLLAAAAAHLANYPTRRWIWRAPYFALMEVAGEMITSALLLALHRERWGSVQADWASWPAMALDALVWRLAEVYTFALLLAGVVYLVRWALLRRDQRETVVEAAHEGPGR